MRLDSTELLADVGKQVPYDIEEPPLVDEDVECTRPIRGRAVFTNAGGTLLIRGNAETTVALPCSRCGQYFENACTFKVEEQFELKHLTGPRTLATVAVVEEDESPVAGKLFDGPVFDLTEMLRQYILVEEPTRPIPPDLPDGRCSHCNRPPEEVLSVLTAAETTADPAEAPINPAFAKLGQLLKEERE